jgi:predicted aldo/keto reductase-like oxidoreductase
MTVFDGCFPLGLGTSRFPISGPDDRQGIEKSVELVRHALNAGVNYIDISYPYSAGMAQTVLKEAFTGARKPVHVTVKVMYDMDKTADDARRRVELQLQAMGLQKASFFTCWTIWNDGIFQEIMKKGGVYEGAVKLREEGLIDHICFSTHAPSEDIIKIIESGAFEGATISYSLLNAANMQSVLDAAQKRHVGVAVMNPLGGGVIAQNADYFSFARNPDEQSTVHAALRFAKAHPAVKIVLGGVQSIAEFDDSVRALTGENTEPNPVRLKRVLQGVANLKGFCTGCKYCEGCPEGIQTPLIMQARNALLFDPVAAYNRSDGELSRNIQLFRRLHHDEKWLPETAENPCIQCGQCEQKCTQKLDIIHAVQDTYARAGRVGFSQDAHIERLRDLLYDKGYQRVGLYPNGGFANLVRALYTDVFGQAAFEWIQFNSDPKMRGEMSGGLQIHAPDEIPDLKPDIIIVCTYKYDREIYGSLQHYENEGIRIVKLHKEDEVPWVF